MQHRLVRLDTYLLVVLLVHLVSLRGLGVGLAKSNQVEMTLSTTTVDLYVGNGYRTSVMITVTSLDGRPHRVDLYTSYKPTGSPSFASFLQYSYSALYLSVPSTGSAHSTLTLSVASDECTTAPYYGHGTYVDTIYVSGSVDGASIAEPNRPSVGLVVTLHCEQEATTTVPRQWLLEITNKRRPADYPSISQAGASYSFTTVIDMNFPACEQDYPCPMVELLDRDTGTVVDTSTRVSNGTDRTWDVQGAHHIVTTTWWARVPSDGRNKWNLRFRVYSPEQGMEDFYDWSVSLQMTTSQRVTSSQEKSTSNEVTRNEYRPPEWALPLAILVPLAVLIGFIIARRIRRPISITRAAAESPLFDVAINVPSVGKTVTLELAPDHTVGSLVETLISTLNLPRDKAFVLDYGGRLIGQSDFGRTLDVLGITDTSKLSLLVVE